MKFYEDSKDWRKFLLHINDIQCFPVDIEEIISFYKSSKIHPRVVLPLPGGIVRALYNPSFGQRPTFVCYYCLRHIKGCGLRRKIIVSHKREVLGKP